MSDQTQSQSETNPSATDQPAETETDPAAVVPVHLGGGPDVADQIAANPDLIHRSAAHHAALTVPPDQRTPEEQAAADELTGAIEAIPEEERTPYQAHLLTLHGGGAAAAEEPTEENTAPADPWQAPQQEA